MTTRVVATRTMSGHGVMTGTWTFAYSTGANQDTTVITSPCGGATKYRFNGTGVSADFTGWRAGTLAEMSRSRTVPSPLESQTMTWIRSEAISNDPVSGPNGVWSDTAVYRPLLQQQTTTRGTHSWTTKFSYHTGHGTINDYGNAHQIEEVGETIYQWRSTTRTFQPGFTPYLLRRGRIRDRAAEQRVRPARRLHSSSSIYDLATGFLDSQTVRGMTTTFEAVGRWQRQGGNAVVDGNPSRTFFTYDWGRVNSVQTPKVTTNFVVAPEGLVTSQTQGDLDDGLRL